MFKITAKEKRKILVRRKVIIAKYKNLKRFFLKDIHGIFTEAYYNIDRDFKWEVDDLIKEGEIDKNEVKKLLDLHKKIKSSMKVTKKLLTQMKNFLS